MKNNGYVLLAEFSKTGALQCAGLELHRYSIEEMSFRLGNQFKLIEHEEFVFTKNIIEKRPNYMDVVVTCIELKKLGVWGVVK